jgi:hypothetical protein
VDFLEDDVDRHEHRTKAMGPARRTARRVRARPRHRPGRCGRSSIRVSCLMRCSLVRTGRAWAASGSMCKATPCATPTGSNEPLYGRTDTKSPMVYSSMVHVAGGEEGSTRHDDDGRPPFRWLPGIGGTMGSR